MILMLFLYDPLYTSSHALESDYPWSGHKDENSPRPKLIKANHAKICTFRAAMASFVQSRFL